MEVSSWQEDELRAYDEGGKLTRASVGYRVLGDVDGDSVEDMVMYYRPDGTAHVVGLWRLTGTVAGRSGSVVFESTGGYDGTVATSEVQVVPGSGTGALTNLRGSGTTSATHERIDYALDLEL
jgi:hypothetical protein